MSKPTRVSNTRITTVTLAALAVVTASGLWYDELLGATVGMLIADVRNERANTADAGKATENYYRGLLSGDEDETQGMIDLVIPDSKRQRGGPREVIQKSGATRPTNNFLPWELIPNTSVPFKGVTLEINQFGQRDRRDYTETKPEGTFRIALAGGSNTMGSGVPMELTFANLLEVRLNAELGNSSYNRFEVINFSVGGYHLPERLFVVQNKVAAFEPDLILVSATDRDLTIQHDRLARKIRKGKKEPIDLQFLKKIIRRADVKRRDELERAVRKLQPFQEDILLGCLDELATYSREHNTELAVFLMRRVGGNRIPKDLAATYEVMKKSEVTILPLFDAYQGVSEMELWLRPDPNPDEGDPHPNIEGHLRIADNLFEQLMGDPKIGAMLRGE